MYYLTSAVPLSRLLYSASFVVSSSFLKSFVFWARSFLAINASRWCVTMSVAVESSSGTSLVRSISVELD